MMINKYNTDITYALQKLIYTYKMTKNNTKSAAVGQAFIWGNQYTDTQELQDLLFTV